MVLILLGVNRIVSLANFSVIFSILKDAYASIQGRMATCFAKKYMTKGQNTSQELGITAIQIFDMFYNLTMSIIEIGDYLIIAKLKSCKYLMNFTE